MPIWTWICVVRPVRRGCKKPHSEAHVYHMYAIYLCAVSLLFTSFKSPRITILSHPKCPKLFYWDSSGTSRWLHYIYIYIISLHFPNETIKQHLAAWNPGLAWNFIPKIARSKEMRLLLGIGAPGFCFGQIFVKVMLSISGLWWNVFFF